MKVNDNLCTKVVCVALFCLLALRVSALAADYYVKTPANGGSDANPATSWDQAKVTIQAAMDLATSTGDRVHVAAGTYNERVSFLEVNGIEDSGETGTGVIHTEPAFAGASDYHLTSSSGDCIDGGTSVGAPGTDLEGTARPQGNGYDMGAYGYVAQATYGDELAVDFDTLWTMELRWVIVH
jgi:hypothetical protein